MSETAVVTPQESQSRRRRIVEALRHAGRLTKEQASELMSIRQGPARPVDEDLESLGYLSSTEMLAALAEYHGRPSVDLTNFQPDPLLAGMLPTDIAQKFEAAPIKFSGNELHVALADPSDVLAEDAVRHAAMRPVHFLVGAQSKVQKLLEQLYVRAEDSGNDLDFAVGPQMERDDHDTQGLSTMELERQAERLPTVRMANQILAAAVQRNASDIHIEPQDSTVQVRLRIDGVLTNFSSLPKSIQPALASRIKVMGNMDIADTRRPQDGRCRVTFNRRVIDLRISSLPTTFGEKIVVRLLDQSGPPMTLDSLQLEEANKEKLQRMMAQPQGLLLVTGPTGSGKSTTLYACISHLKEGSTNIVTVEDPVERQISGVNQVAINERAGVTFASALRSILRQDPNVIMVGEIRDEETAQMAMKAGLTGHLVLSTLHTNDAASAITRLLEIGVPGHLLSPALIGVVAQRLVRRVCTACKGRANQDPIHPRGCRACHYTGFKGRVALIEILEITPPLAALISRGATAEEIRSVARSLGMKLLPEDALAKVEEGVTTREEISLAVDLNHYNQVGQSLEAVLESQFANSSMGMGHSSPNSSPGMGYPSANSSFSAPAPATMLVEPTQAASPNGSSEPAVVLPPVLEEAPAAPSAPRILIVEDSRSIRHLLTDTLERNFYTILQATDGLEGVKMAIAEAPDLIIADVVMPNMDGYEMCKHLRNNPRTRNIPIVMLTGQDALEEEIRGLEVGADDYIHKPVEAKRLLARIHVALRRRGK